MPLRIDQLTAIAAGTVDPAADLLEVHDTTATGSRKIPIADLLNAVSKWTDYTPSTYTDNTSDGITGGASDVSTMFDGNYMQIEEAAGVPGYDVEFVFSGLTLNPRFVVARWLYSGSSTHDCTWDIWNYSTSAWDQIRLFGDSSAYWASMTMYIPIANDGDYVSAGAAKVRVYHHTTGNAAHYIQVDYVGLTHSLQ